MDLHENRVHERLFEGPQVEDARRNRPWHPESGGARPLRDLPLYHQALAKKEAPDGEHRDDEDPRKTRSERRGLEAVAAFSTGEKPRPDLGRALRSFLR